MAYGDSSTHRSRMGIRRPRRRGTAALSLGLPTSRLPSGPLARRPRADWPDAAEPLWPFRHVRERSRMVLGLVRPGLLRRFAAPESARPRPRHAALLAWW